MAWDGGDQHGLNPQYFSFIFQDVVDHDVAPIEPCNFQISCLCVSGLYLGTMARSHRALCYIDAIHGGRGKSRTRPYLWRFQGP